MSPHEIEIAKSVVRVLRMLAAKQRELAAAAIKASEQPVKASEQLVIKLSEQYVTDLATVAELIDGQASVLDEIS